ncbi:hypothetical protein AJ80_00215 [Polytolypa hystricis UAMH7299]|uniref:Ribosomal RNA-processing protein 8 n=1 Tax=Polytolypa hystricis (strain UAMH7299) TaxID=1447883 RepID=A0A2B7Z3M3_POLH7|nr:hypothetical protein AJ80_00215 [Polytolypa hystricis UAMH7299]
MFAIQGWSVSAADLKVQAEQKPAPAQAPSQETPDTGAEIATKKRKRNNRGKNGQADKVTKGNVDEMWKKHIEGVSADADAEKKEAMKEQRKKRKLEKKNKSEGDAAVVNGEKAEDKDVGEAVSTQTATNATESQPQTRRQRRKEQKRKSQGAETVDSTKATATPATTTAAAEANTPPPAATSTLTPLQQSMRQKLVSARFRHLNQTLYTTPSNEALELFTNSPELFAEYHAGFSQQVKDSWPSNPVDTYISSIKSRAKLRPNTNQKSGNRQSSALLPIPRRPNGICTIADLGCGDGQLAHALTPSLKQLKLRIHSFDLHSPDPLITKADMSALPLADGTVDVTIFCLSLMGTNWVSFVEEAWRVLRGDGKGECWVSEVKSRFGKVSRNKAANAKDGPQKPSAGKKDKFNKNKKQRKDDEGEDDGLGEEIFAEDQRARPDADETDISAFIEVFRTRGFVLKQESVEKSNKMFVKMEFVKHGRPSKGKFAGPAADAGGQQQRGGMLGKKKFLDREDTKGMTEEQESKVLKPCVYKTR